MSIYSRDTYDVVIVGGGATGTALLYVLSTYTNIQHIVLLEKNSKLAQVNSRSNNNSQTLHVGDIETNYTLEKATKVKREAFMVKHYADRLSPEERDSFLSIYPKMVLAVGDAEVAELHKRYAEFKNLYPYLKKYSREDIARIEPQVVAGRDPQEHILALGTETGYAINFEKLSESLAKNAQAKAGTKTVEVHTDTKVTNIEKTTVGYALQTTAGPLNAPVVVFATDAHSILYAKQLGYAKEYSIVPIAGNFYFAPEVLNGKVYTVQDKRLPFAAVHGDPDVSVPNKTRFGPTAKIMPILESRNLSTLPDFFRAMGFDIATVRSFIAIMANKVQLSYMLRNILYDIPFFGKRLFIQQVQKIVPTLLASDITKAKGFGGMRMQTVNKQTRSLELGEKKIIGDNIIFNSAPSPGASICLGNAEKDARTIINFLGKKYSFDEKLFEQELVWNEATKSQ